MKWVLISSTIAWPLGWIAMDGWLQNFAYTIELEWWMFALPVMAAIVISSFTVSIQAIRAAFNNPIEALKSEGA